MTQALDKIHAKVYISINDLTVSEREVIQEVRAIDSGRVTACKDKGVITHIRIEKTKKL